MISLPSARRVAVRLTRALLWLPSRGQPTTEIRGITNQDAPHGSDGPRTATDVVCPEPYHGRVDGCHARPTAEEPQS